MTEWNHKNLHRQRDRWHDPDRTTKMYMDRETDGITMTEWNHKNVHRQTERQMA